MHYGIIVILKRTPKLVSCLCDTVSKDRQDKKDSPLNDLSSLTKKPQAELLSLLLL